MRLRAGLLHPSPQWQQLLSQEGFPAAVVDFNDFKPSDWSLLVLNRAVEGKELSIISSYLHGGGAILTFMGHAGGLVGVSNCRSQIEYVVSRSGDPLEDVGLVDIETDCLVSREANVFPTEKGENSIFIGALGKGYAADLPFDPATILFDSRRSTRLFYATRERLPAEEVSHVGKGAIRFLIHRVLELLHHARGLQYAHLGYFPGGRENLFAYRIDTDGGSRVEIEELHSVASKCDIPLSWYLDVKSHEQWLGVFRSFQGHETGVHCYEHRTYDSSLENSENIARALGLMRASGMDPAGFSSPFGHWNTGLAQAIDELGFLYSSEFSFAYDTLPFYPESSGRRFKALQIPIHPVCIGSMLRVGYGEQDMKQYFHRSVDWKLCRSEPLFYYHHPANGCLDVVKDHFDYVKARGIGTTTLADFARWWKEREEIHFELATDGGKTEFRIASPRPANHSVWLDVSSPDGFSKMISRETGTAIRSEGEWQPVLRALPPQDIRRTREFDVRAFLGYWYNYFLRKLR